MERWKKMEKVGLNKANQEGRNESKSINNLNQCKCTKTLQLQNKDCKTGLLKTKTKNKYSCILFNRD